MLVLLRVAIGWHFLFAGLSKLASKEFSSESFLSQAKGPLADRFLSLLPDQTDRGRLNPANWHEWTDDLDADLGEFKVLHPLSPEQVQLADAISHSYQKRTEDYLDEKREAIDDWLHGLARAAEVTQDPAKDAHYQQKRRWDARTKGFAAAKAWLSDLEKIRDECRASLLGLVTDPAQRREFSPRAKTALDWQDLLITWSNIAIGICLIAGLFTRLAAFGGGVFLLLVVLAQPDWPGLYPPPHPSAGRAFFVTKEFIEMLALFTLAATPVGRWGGLDYFIHNLLVRPIFRRREA